MKYTRSEPVQASRLIPRNTFAGLGTQQDDEQQEGGSASIAQLIDLRLPGNLSNCIRLQPGAFDEASYKVEPNVSYKDEKGILKTRQCNLTNFIRWRYAKDGGSEAATKAKKDDIESHRLETQVGLTQVANAPKVESNTKVVEWSDGTKSLIIGD